MSEERDPQDEPQGDPQRDSQGNSQGVWQVSPSTCTAYGQTDVGLRRPHNEDSILLLPEHGLFAVADGMGGHAAGEVASRAAVTAFGDFFQVASRDRDFTWPFGFDERSCFEENLVVAAAQMANRKVCEIALENPECMGMGTTLAALLAYDRHVVIAHVGDSRVYRLRKEALELLTSDHSWVNEQIQRNVLTEEEARSHRWRNVITRALGNRPDIDIDRRVLDAQEGDLFVLCTDGLTAMLEDPTIAEILLRDGHDLSVACQSLIDQANQAGGLDNISIILARIE
jgi:protein phosphatase